MNYSENMTSNGAGDTLFSSGNSNNYVALLNTNYHQSSNGTEIVTLKRERDRDREAKEKEERRQKRRRSRWGGDEKEKTFIPGMPTVLPTNLSKEQEKAYLGMLIQDVHPQGKSGNFV